MWPKVKKVLLWKEHPMQWLVTLECGHEFVHESKHRPTVHVFYCDACLQARRAARAHA